MDYISWIVLLSVLGNGAISMGSRLQPQPTYLVIAPMKIYPSMTAQVSVSILRLDYPEISVRASVRKGGEEFASFVEKFTQPSTRTLQLQIPDDVQPGNYSLRVEGVLHDAMSGVIFENETQLLFDMKQASVFITINKPVYHQGETVHFRVIPVKPNLLPAHGSMDITIKDATGVVVRRWLGMQTNAGILNMNAELSDQPSYGQWSIRVHAFGVTYNKSFTVEEFFLPRMHVNVSMPLSVVENTFGIAGVINANHTSGGPCKGNGTIKIEIRDAMKTLQEGKHYYWPVIHRVLHFFEGKTGFLITMEELRQLVPQLAEKEIHVTVEISDWFLQISAVAKAITVIYPWQPKVVLLGDRSRSFKPGFRQSVHFAVLNADGSHVQSPQRQMTLTYFERRLSSTSKTEEVKKVLPDDGVVQYDFVPSVDAELITIRGIYDLSTVECYLYRVFSHQDVFIHVSTSTDHPTVNTYMIFTVKTSVYVDHVNYMVVSGGNIMLSEVLSMKAKQKTFPIALSGDMVPSARIVVHFVHNSEVVADSLNFFVNGTTFNKVEASINAGKDFSRDSIEVSGRTQPGSYMAFQGIDQDLFNHYGEDVFLTENQVYEELETYDSHCNQSYRLSYVDEHYHRRKIYFPSPSYGSDANTTFMYAGLVVFTDANVTGIIHYCNETLGFLPCNDGSCFTAEQRCDDVMQCEDGVDEMGCHKETVDIFTPVHQRFTKSPRHYTEDGLWLWKDHYVKADGRVDIEVGVPKEPMSWVVTAISLSKDTGLGWLQSPLHYQSTRFFYIIVETPEVVVSGEQIGVRVAVFNYWHEDLECLVTLHDSENYRHIVVHNGITNSYNPRTARGDFQTMVYVTAGHMSTVYFPVLPVSSSDVTVVISATSFMGQDVVRREIQIKALGVTNFYNTPYLLDLINQGSKIIPDFDIVVPERFIKPQERYHLYVPGSEKATLSVVGDIVGPGFFEKRMTASNLMRLPYGSAENIVFNYAVKLHYLKYLKATSQLPDKLLKETLDTMNLDLQRILSYYQSGSFTMFRDGVEVTPSVQLTAYALQALCLSDQADWTHELFIPADLVNTIATWLVGQQNSTTGAFAEPHVSNVTSEESIRLTSRVLIALTDANCVSGSARPGVETAKDAAAAYLEDFIYDLNDSCLMALMTFALTVARSNQVTNAFYRLEAMKRSDSAIYWSNKAIPANPVRVVDTTPYMLPRELYPHEASAVEATSYALMVYLHLNRVTEALPIMKWLQTMRNSVGGFGSTRDSIVAIQALAEYATRDSNRDLYHVRLEVEVTSVPGWKKVIDLNEQNWQDANFIEIPKVFGQVKTRAQGTGLALLQLHTEVNVEYPWQQAPVANGSFYDVSLETLYFHGKNFSIMEMTLCSRSLGHNTELTILEVGLPTGYIATNDILRKYVQSHQVPGLSRAEQIGSKIHFYLQHLPVTHDVCVSVRADRWYPIANASFVHEIKIYDYFEPGVFNRTTYTTYNLFLLHTCQVCGSFQCPYCPFYNTAPVVMATVAMTLATMLMGLLLQHIR